MFLQTLVSVQYQCAIVTLMETINVATLLDIGIYKQLYFQNSLPLVTETHLAERSSKNPPLYCTKIVCQFDRATKMNKFSFSELNIVFVKSASKNHLLQPPLPQHSLILQNSHFLYKSNNKSTLSNAFTRTEPNFILAAATVGTVFLALATETVI